MDSNDFLALVRREKGVVAHRYGGQLRRLHQALCDPLHQETGVVLLGDSITWGLRLAGNAVELPRNHALSDPRDRFDTPSWANEFKRAIGSDYFGGAAPSLSNWPGALSGESTVQYSRGVELYPGLAPFVSARSGHGAAPHEVACSGARLGYLYRFTDAGDAVGQALAFQFTGTAFTLFFTSIAADSPMNYELIVAGVSQGTFSTFDGTRHGVSRTHTFARVRKQTIEIRPIRTAAAGVQHLDLEAVRIEKTCRITNQGLIGNNVKACLERNFSAGRMDGLDAMDDFVIVQFGTNDRIGIFSKYGQPDCVNNFVRNMHILIDKLQAAADVILMAAGPAAVEAGRGLAFSMPDVRNALDGVACRSGLDLVDHYAALQGFALTDILADGLHPNELGHALMARNLLGALRGA